MYSVHDMKFLYLMIKPNRLNSKLYSKNMLQNAFGFKKEEHKHIDETYNSNEHWQIQGGAAGVRPLLRVPILSFWHTNFTKCRHFGSWHPLLQGWCPLLREILDPPLMNIMNKETYIQFGRDFICVVWFGMFPVVSCHHQSASAWFYTHPPCHTSFWNQMM